MKGSEMAQKDADLQKIEEIIEIMEKKNLVEVEIKHGEDKILLKRAQPQAPVAAVPMMTPVVPTAPVGVGAAPAATAEQRGLVDKIKCSRYVLCCAQPGIGTLCGSRY
jgi:hypothetical protein